MSPSGISRTQGNVRLASAKWAKAVINQVAVAQAHNVLLTERGSQAIVTPTGLFWSYPGVSHHHPASAVLVWLDAARGRCQAPVWLVAGLHYEDWSYSSSKRGGRIRLGH